MVDFVIQFRCNEEVFFIPGNPDFAAHFRRTREDMLAVNITNLTRVFLQIDGWKFLPFIKFTIFAKILLRHIMTWIVTDSVRHFNRIVIGKFKNHLDIMQPVRHDGTRQQRNFNLCSLFCRQFHPRRSREFLTGNCTANLAQRLPSLGKAVFQTQNQIALCIQPERFRLKLGSDFNLEKQKSTEL